MFKDIGTKLSGLTIQLLAFLGLVATTSMSIAGGIGDFKGDIKKFAFAIALIFAQLTIFKVSTCETIVKRSFNGHYVPLKLIQYGLLIVSINYNYKFFSDNSIITFLLCVLVDTSVIKFVTLAADMRDGRTEENPEAYSLPGIFFYNLIANFRLTQLAKYRVNREKLAGVNLAKDQKVNPIKVNLAKVNLKLAKPRVDYITDVGGVNLLEEVNPEDQKVNPELTQVQKFIDGLTPDEIIKSGEIKVNFGLTNKQWEKVRSELTGIKKVGTKLKKT